MREIRSVFVRVNILAIVASSCLIALFVVVSIVRRKERWIAESGLSVPIVIGSLITAMSLACLSFVLAVISCAICCWLCRRGAGHRSAAPGLVCLYAMVLAPIIAVVAAVIACVPVLALFVTYAKSHTWQILVDQNHRLIAYAMVSLAIVVLITSVISLSLCIRAARSDIDLYVLTMSPMVDTEPYEYVDIGPHSKYGHLRESHSIIIGQVEGGPPSSDDTIGGELYEACSESLQKTAGRLMHCISAYLGIGC